MPVEKVLIPTVERPLRFDPRIGRAHPGGAAFIVYPFLLLSNHDDTLDPVIVIVLLSAASNQSCSPPILPGSKPRKDCWPRPTNDIFTYSNRIVLDDAPEIARVCVLEEGITRGLVRPSVFVRVIESDAPVALRSDQKFPPADVAVDAGSVTALKPEFVR
jgi:hypothetical protein